MSSFGSDPGVLGTGDAVDVGHRSGRWQRAADLYKRLCEQ